MPVYDLKCPACGKGETDYPCSSDTCTEQVCSVCGGVLDVVIHPVVCVKTSSFMRGLNPRVLIRHTDQDGKKTEMDVSKHIPAPSTQPRR